MGSILISSPSVVFSGLDSAVAVVLAERLSDLVMAMAAMGTCCAAAKAVLVIVLATSSFLSRSSSRFTN